jgi:hypothetical protein
LLEKIGSYGLFDSYFPEERDIDKLPRQWIANVGYTLIGDEFQQWVKNVVSERNARIVASNEMSIELDPEIAKAFF